MLFSLLMTTMLLLPQDPPKPDSPTTAKKTPSETVLGKAMESYTDKIPGTDLEITWVAIPVGEEGYPSQMKMGSPENEKNRKKDEGPNWTLQAEPFWMMKFEVTWDLFDEFRKEYGILQEIRLDPSENESNQWADAVSIPTPLWEQDARPILEGLGTQGGFPVADITQFAAMQFSKWLSKKTGTFLRLPTEAEWEYAARCGSEAEFPFTAKSESVTDHAWIFDNSEYEDPDAGYPGLASGYRKVGLLKANPWGIHDLHGNVAEWTLDRYAPDTYSDRKGKTLTVEESVVWPSKIWPAVVRGGSWQDDADRCRSAARTPSSSQWQRRDPQIPKSIWWCTDAFHVGFRLIRPAQVPENKNRWWDPEIGAIQRKLKNGYKELRAPVPHKKTTEKE
ncbi:MAG: SUMF1/EgtB/PvdO family nonheme iron enzyme [Planctomycetia bacterium]|nr:SUMF1/EgtB/PvdO family nonheme iron enzyme [Planctomycetia bacterium]NCG13251.1 SUMF1/EgtB/PvdO family nonheme iron enzyme [Planctomycetia bacterium]